MKKAIIFGILAVFIILITGCSDNAFKNPKEISEFPLCYTYGSLYNNETVSDGGYHERLEINCTNEGLNSRFYLPDGSPIMLGEGPDLVRPQRDAVYIGYATIGNTRSGGTAYSWINAEGKAECDCYYVRFSRSAPYSQYSGCEDFTSLRDIPEFASCFE